VPSLTYRRGLAAEKAGDAPQALRDTYAGASQGGATDAVAGWFRVAALASRLGRNDDDWQIVLRACDEIERSFDGSGVEGEQRSRGLVWHRSQAQFRLGEVEDARAGLQSLAGGTDTWSLSARQLLNAPIFTEQAEALMVRPSDQ